GASELTAEARHDVAEDLAEIHRRKLEVALPRSDPRDIEQLVDAPPEAAILPDDRRDRLPRPLWEVAGLFQTLRGQVDRHQRSPNLVRRDSEELVARAQGVLRP